MRRRKDEPAKGRRRNIFNTEGGIVTPLTRRATEAYPAYSDGSATRRGRAGGAVSAKLAQSEVMKVPPNVKILLRRA